MKEFRVKISLYSKELEEVCNAMSLEKYLEFVEKWYNLGIIDKKTYDNLKNSGEVEQNNAYCYTILYCIGDNITKEAREWAKNHRIKKEEVNA